MNLKKYLATIEGIKLENMAHRYVTFGLMIVVVMLAISNSMKTQVVQLIPPTLNEQAFVDKSSASASYTEAWALYVAQTLGNVTPGTSGMIRKTIEPLLAPDIFQEVVNSIESQVEAFRRDRVVLRFEPKRVVSEKGRDNVYFITGSSIVEGPTGDKTSTEYTYEVHLKIRRYQPVITYLSSYKGRPKTEDVIERETKVQERRGEQAKKAERS